jgi:hypothetical protein
MEAKFDKSFFWKKEVYTNVLAYLKTSDGSFLVCRFVTILWTIRSKELI